MRYVKTMMTLISYLLVTSCADDEVANTYSPLCSDNNTEPAREVHYAHEPTSQDCEWIEGFRNEAEARVSLRKAGVCLLHIESRENTNQLRGFPCHAFWPFWFIAQVPETDLQKAVDAGWTDPYSDNRILQIIRSRNFLQQKKADLQARLTPPPDCCKSANPYLSCEGNGQQSEACLSHEVEKKFIKDTQLEINEINEQLLRASEVTGKTY